MGNVDFELYTYLDMLQTENNRNMPNFKFFHLTVIAVDYC